MNIVLIGGGNQVVYTIDIIEKQGLFNIVGIIDSRLEIGSDICGYKIIGRQEDINQLIDIYNFKGCVITIGDNWSRKCIFEQISNLSPNLSWPNAIHPSVIIGKNVKLGIGIIAMAGVIVNVEAKLGDFTNYFTRCNIEHHCIIGDFSSVSAGVVLGGRVTIGKYSAISLNATVFDRVTIGENSVIGSASLVTKDISNNVLVYGNPARIIRERKLGEKFLK
ncbi:MAG: NeuD/PglB/VioB family sugar acetyltransferase [Polaribacter sp.]|uniref:NeuD/PglB/VioB family sugar acetyltransferase n=1 Tax=Polaribacter sp. TaxID=1920175 RepID=UPI0032636514